jgi:hypothetical protein
VNSRRGGPRNRAGLSGFRILVRKLRERSNEIGRTGNVADSRDAVEPKAEGLVDEGESRHAIESEDNHRPGAAHGGNDTAELDDAAVAGTLDDPSAMQGDCGIDRIAAQRAQSRQSTIFVGAREPAVADHIRD